MPDNTTIDPKDPRKALRALVATALFLILIFVLAHFGEYLGLRDGEPGIFTGSRQSGKAEEAFSPAPAEAVGDAPSAEGSGAAVKTPKPEARIPGRAVILVRVFDEKGEPLPDAELGLAERDLLRSTKSMIGHLLGASGGAELVACVLCLRNSVVHPTINLENPDPDCDLDCVPNQPREMVVERVLSNSFGFGGHNGSLLIGKFSG